MTRTYNLNVVRKKDTSARTYNKPVKKAELKIKYGKDEKLEKKSKKDK